MSKKEKAQFEQIRIPVEGHPESYLYMWPKSGCGNITNGVGFSHGNGGAWVISYQSLKRMYEYAKEARARR